MEGFGDKLRHELRAAFALLAKDLPVHHLDTGFGERPNVIQSRVNCSTHSVLLGNYHPKLCNGLAENKMKPPGVSPDPLLHKQAMICHMAQCEWQAVVQEERNITLEQMRLHRVSFGNMVCHSTTGIATQLTLQAPYELKAPPIPSLKTTKIPPLRMKTRQSAKAIPAVKGASQNFPKRFYWIPLTKKQVPLHRIPNRAKAFFRQQLAKKLGGSPSKISITRVFEHIHMPLYEKIDQNEKGELLCFPRAEVVGKLRKDRPEAEAQYLVFGAHLDTQQRGSTLVSMSAVETLLATEESL